MRSSTKQWSFPSSKNRGQRSSLENTSEISIAVWFTAKLGRDLPKADDAKLGHKLDPCLKMAWLDVSISYRSAAWTLCDLLENAFTCQFISLTLWDAWYCLEMTSLAVRPLECSSKLLYTWASGCKYGSILCLTAWVTFSTKLAGSVDIVSD